MARTLTEIQDEIIAAVQGDATLSGASSTSSTAIWRLWTYIIASAVWALESIFDAFKADLVAQVNALRPHTLRWYQARALDFQFGSDLPEGETVYDNSLLDDATVTAQKIIKAAAAVGEGGQVIVKVARESAGVLTTLNGPQLTAFEAYMGEIKDAGVDLVVRNQAADKFKLTLDIYYDPLVLTSGGDRVDGTATGVVATAVNAFLRALPFNGLLVKAHLVDALQAVDGVYVPVIRSCQAGRFDATSLSEIDVQYNPYAGYLKFENQSTDLVITYTSQEDI